MYDLNIHSPPAGIKTEDSLANSDRHPSDSHLMAGDRYSESFIAECDLRHKGRLVFHDWHQCSLWVFDLPAPNTKQSMKNDDLVDAEPLLKSHGFTSERFNLLRLSEH